ncbi:hypothetical protein H8959_019271 [Pygathrix nigripes]
MCPPVSVRYEEEGMSYLYASWMYQLQHDQLSICFTCFKAAFLDLKDLLESEDWEEDNWDPELMEHTDAESEQEGSSEMELSWGQSPVQPVQEGSEAWGLGTLASAPEGLEDAGEPMALGLGITWAVDPAEDEAWLLALQLVSMVGCYDATYLPSPAEDDPRQGPEDPRAALEIAAGAW